MYQHILSEGHVLLRGHLTQATPTCLVDAVSALQDNCFNLADSLCAYPTSKEAIAMATRYLILSGLTVAEVFQHVTGNYSKVGEGKGMWGRKKEKEEREEREGGKKIEGSKKGGHYKFSFVLLQPSCTAYSVLMKYLNLVLFENENITSQAQWVSLVIDCKFTVILMFLTAPGHPKYPYPCKLLLCHNLIALSTEAVKGNNHQYMRLSSSQYFELNYTHTCTHTHTAPSNGGQNSGFLC